MIVTEDALQQVLRRRVLQRQKLLPREGGRGDGLTTRIIVIGGGMIIGLTVFFSYIGSLGWQP